jgi:hypothetical protein
MARSMPGPNPNELVLVLEEAEIYALRDVVEEAIAQAAAHHKKWPLLMRKPMLEQIRRALCQPHRRQEAQSTKPADSDETWML